MSEPKPKVIKDYERLDQNVQEQIKLAYPYGFAKNLIYFTDREGMKVSALPFETDDRYYLVRMTKLEAQQIIKEDDDYNELGQLKEEVRDDYEDKYSDLDYMNEYTSDQADENIEEIPDDTSMDEDDF
jgi:hypothetical protein